MEPKLERFLMKCGLKEAIGTFLKHDIGFSQIVELNENEIIEIFPKIGDRLKFRSAIKKLTTEYENPPPAKRKRTLINSSTSSRARSPDRDVKKKEKSQLTVEQILKTDETMARSLREQANQIFENFAKKFKIATSSWQLFNGKILCPLCQEEFTPQIRKDRPTLGWNLGNVKRHLMTHTPESVSNVNSMLEVIINENVSNKEHEQYIKAASDSKKLHNAGKVKTTPKVNPVVQLCRYRSPCEVEGSEKQSSKRSLNAESLCVKVKTIDEEKSDLEAESDVKDKGSSNQTNGIADAVKQNIEALETNQSFLNNPPEWTAFGIKNTTANQLNDESIISNQTNSHDELDELNQVHKAVSEVNDEGSSNQKNEIAQTVERNFNEALETNQSFVNNPPEWTAFGIENPTANQLNDESIMSNQTNGHDELNQIPKAVSEVNNEGSSNQTNGIAQIVSEPHQSLVNNPPDWTAFGIENPNSNQVNYESDYEFESAPVWTSAVMESPKATQVNDESDYEFQSTELLELKSVNVVKGTLSKDDVEVTSRQWYETVERNFNEELETNQSFVNNPPEWTAFGTESPTANKINDETDNEVESSELLTLKPVDVVRNTESSNISNYTETVELNENLNEADRISEINEKETTKKLIDKNSSESEILNEMQVNVAVMDNAGDEELPEWRKEVVKYGWIKLRITDKIFYPGFVLRDGTCKYITSKSKLTSRKYSFDEYHENLSNSLKDDKKLRYLLDFNRLHETNYE